MLLRDRTIARVTVARFVARLGGEAAFFIGVWGLAAYEFEASASQIAVLMVALAAASMLGASVAGSLVDRFGPRTVLIGAQFVYVPVAVATAFVGSLAELVGMCVLFGLTTSTIMTASGSFAPYLTDDPERMESINALIEGAGALSFVMGPALGALVAGAFSIQAVFFADAALTTLGALLVVPVATPPVAGPKKHPVSDIVDGLRVTYSLRGVRYYVLMGTLMWFSFGAFGALEPLFFRDVVGTGVETIGYVNSVFGAGIAFGAWLLTRMPAKLTSARGLSIAVAMSGFGAALYVGTPNLWVIGCGALLWGAVLGAAEPLLRTLMQIDSPEEYVGRVMGTAQVHRSAGELVPLALAPALAAAFGVQQVMIGGAVLAAVISLATWSHAASIDAAGRVDRRVRLDEALATDDPISPIT